MRQQEINLFLFSWNTNLDSRTGATLELRQQWLKFQFSSKASANDLNESWNEKGAFFHEGLLFYKIVLNLSLRYESSTFILIRSWVALSFKVCESASKISVTPDQIFILSIYKGINALYWRNNIIDCPIVTQYRQVPKIDVQYWPSAQLHKLVTHSWANWI